MELKKMSDKVLKDVPLKELLRHSSEHEDPWTAICGKVYRVKEWRNKHPGGSFLIDLASGRDATILLQSYHPSKKIPTVKKFLSRLEVVGNLKYQSYEEYLKIKNEAGAKQLVNAEALGRVGCDENDKFWVKVNERVYKALKEANIDWRWYEWVHQLEIVLTLVTWLWCVYFNYYSNCHNWFILAFTVLLQGFLIGRMGIIQHTANHAGCSSIPILNRIEGMSASMVGVDHEDWIYWHNGSHHIAPNQLDIDANLTNNYPVNRLHSDLPWKPVHAWQVTVYTILLMIGYIKWFTLDLYHAFKDDRKMLEFKPKKGFQYWAFKVWWMGSHIILPRIVTGGWGHLACLNFSYMVAGYYLGLGFLVAHYHADLYDPKYTKPGLHWALLNVVGSANWCAGSKFHNWFWGGMTHQIEHHLFPSMNHMVYPFIQQAVEQTCKDFGYTYRNHETFLGIWKSFYNYLRLMGVRPPIDIH